MPNKFLSFLMIFLVSALISITVKAGGVLEEKDIEDLKQKVVGRPLSVGDIIELDSGRKILYAEFNGPRPKVGYQSFNVREDLSRPDRKFLEFDYCISYECGFPWIDGARDLICSHRSKKEDSDIGEQKLMSLKLWDDISEVTSVVFPTMYYETFDEFTRPPAKV
jgi:hypothetical protein